MSNARNRAISVGSAITNLPKYSSSRRSHSTVTGLTSRTLRVVVLGVGGVGKTAMTVRFVTKRFIGDYDPNLETIYRHTTLVEDQLVNFEIMDTAGQGENNLMLEDKCKWGESFIFVYDVTDKHSFDELMRLKFIASYTHSRMRVNFTPCWVLVGNKVDLAERERMVTLEEGEALSRDLGCHIFREISVKESMSEASKVFEDLWRYFIALNPRSPSSNQRRKFSIKIQEKIPVLDSTCSSCPSEALKILGSNTETENEMLVTTLTSSLKRQISSGLLSNFNYRNAKQYLSKNDKSIPSIPENIKEDDEDEPVSLPTSPLRYQRSRRNALITDQSSLTDHSDSSERSPPSEEIRSKPAKLAFPEHLNLKHLTTSSRSSSNGSLSSLTSSSSTVTSLKSEGLSRERNQSDSDIVSALRRKERKNEFDFSPNNGRREYTRSQKNNKSKYPPFPTSNGTPKIPPRSSAISINV